ncbi:AEC family transporter [Acinetobacter larvae]|uniref:Permease n=1 Tax=Acinetobacter larvae TaxID=1789224 RepID=A0A1B2M312_9GAMM|nr:permease [Acinetobacter larvae]AOA59413.1 permease [Acinetobacter larvae]
MSFLFPIASLLIGLVLAHMPAAMWLRSVLAKVLARCLIPVVIIYNVVFYQPGSLSLMLFSIATAVLLYISFRLLRGDRLQALCFSYTNIGWLGFPLAIAMFGAEVSAAMIALYIGGSIFGNIWSVSAVSHQKPDFKQSVQKVLCSPPLLALLIALLLYVVQFQHWAHLQWVNLLYSLAKTAMSFAGMCVLGMWLAPTRVQYHDLQRAAKTLAFKMLCGVVICSLAYRFLNVAFIQQHIAVIFLIFCLPPAANIVALETHYQGTGVSAKYIAAGTMVSMVGCAFYALALYIFQDASWLKAWV